MSLAWFRFYEELNDFLPGNKRKSQFPWSFMGTPSVKDAIEALGVPHTEVDMILVNGISVDFSYKIENEDYVSVYPVFESFDITTVTHLKERPLRDLKFIADVHLGRLTKYLRLCGFDVSYKTSMNDEEIIDLSLTEKRVILTRDKGLLKNKKVTHGHWVRSQNSRDQLYDILLKFDLKNKIRPFTRCMECNGILVDVSKDEIINYLLPDTSKYFLEFKKCPECNRIYWKGSHFERMQKTINEIIKELK